MANDMFGGLGGLMKGLSSILPQDDPNVKLLSVQTELKELKAKETDAYARLGRQVAAAQGLDAYPQIATELQSLALQIQAAESKLGQAQSEKAAQDKAAETDKNARTCPQCGLVNEPGCKFCQECGAKLGVATAKFCPSCGAENPVGGRFCVSCGGKLD